MTIIIVILIALIITMSGGRLELSVIGTACCTLCFCRHWLIVDIAYGGFLRDKVVKFGWGFIVMLDDIVDVFSYY